MNPRGKSTRLPSQRIEPIPPNSVPIMIEALYGDPTPMTDEQMARHVEVDHHQGEVAYEGAPEMLRLWHDWEHRAVLRYRGHAHDPFTARRLGIPLAVPLEGSRR